MLICSVCGCAVRQSREPGWLEGVLSGKKGLIPHNYVEFLNWRLLCSQILGLPWVSLFSGNSWVYCGVIDFSYELIVAVYFCCLFGNNCAEDCDGQSHNTDFYLFYFFLHKLVHIDVVLDLPVTDKRKLPVQCFTLAMLSHYIMWGLYTVFCIVELVFDMYIVQYTFCMTEL